MKKEKIEELSQKIFETAYGINKDLEDWKKEDLVEAMYFIQEYSNELQKELGGDTTVTYLTLNPQQL